MKNNQGHIIKTKYDRRRAIECKMERKSNSNPGYFNYNITIREKNGAIHTEPAYGKDMQDALSRLIYTERTVMAWEFSLYAMVHIVYVYYIYCNICNSRILAKLFRKM